MVISARGYRTAAGGVAIPLFWLARPLGMGPYKVTGQNRPARGFDWGLHYEIAGVLRCIRPDRHGDGLPYWPGRRALVGGSEFARVPCVFLFCFLGCLAVGRASHLISRGFPHLTALISEPAPCLVGFHISRRKQSVSKYGGTS
jgi:hypothetical protein